MSRNKKGRWWYLAFKTLSLREILLPVIGFAISFVWIWNAAGQYLNLFKELQKPVVIQAEMSQNLSSDMRTSILSMQGVEALTPYSEQTAVMQWEDYSGEVSVYYVESDYMKWLSGQAVTAGVPFSGGMPYGIVSEKALENLKKKTEGQSRITSMQSESESAADENRVTDRSSQKDKKKQGLALEKAIATVDNNGTVTGVKAGKVTITGQITGVQDANKKDLTIKASTEITINAAAALTLALDRTEAWIGVNKNTTLAATVTNYKSDSGVTWTTSDKTVATVDEKGVVTGVKAGSAKITATTKEKDASGKNLTATCVVTVNSDAMNDTTTKLKDKNGNQLYVKNADGSYREAVYADYFTASEFYMKTEGQYAYTGWQTINGKTYFYDKSGKAVTGTQIIQGVTYNFGSDGAIQTSVNGSKFGIDISRHNGKIDWNAVKSSGVDYVIIRCGYRGSSSGALITDQNFQSNIKGATAAGLKVGIYVFSQAVNEVEAVKEASLAVSLAKGYKLTYPIFIDTESSGGRADKIDVATRTAVVNAFCQTVQSAGYQAGIYASKTWFETKLSMGSVGNYRIWLAQYAAAPTYSGRYDMWQYSSKGTISGINGKVDLNLSYLAY